MPNQNVRLSLPSGRRSPMLVRWFIRYVRGYLRKNFHAVRLTLSGPPLDPVGPVIVVLNHPSWWDPLVCAVLTELFPNRAHYAPIENEALAKYRFFERIGLFGIEPGTVGGGRVFLRTATELLAGPNAMLWVTAQGQFTDPRQRPVQLAKGVGHLLCRLETVTVLPLALEYPFWNERYPEALAHFGLPITVSRGSERSADEWTHCLQQSLTETMDQLAVAAQSRAPAFFRTLIGGSTGVGGVYDLWRRFKAMVRGKRFQPAHGESGSL